MIDNLNGLAALFRRVFVLGGDREDITRVAKRLVEADVGVTAVQPHMSEEYRLTVMDAKRWLRDHRTLA